MDDDEGRRKAILDDVEARILSRENASLMRGHEEGEMEIIEDEREIEAQMMSGGIVPKPDLDETVPVDPSNPENDLDK